MKKLLLLFVLFFFSSLNAEEYDFEIRLEKFQINNLIGVHSFTYATYENYILIIGGRKDGLHARQPFNTFPAASSNDDLILINTSDWSVKYRKIDFNNQLTDQLKSTNMNFAQYDDKLYIVGGFGYSNQLQDHTTFNKLIIVSIPDLINSIIDDQNIEDLFSFIEDDYFAITGGHLAFNDDKFYLVGGHDFQGRYNPMGHSTFTQAYSNQVRIFSISENNGTYELNKINEITDEVNLRRRDYNLVPQISNGKIFHTIYAGVFQINADLPFLYPVDVFEDKITPHQSFNQYYNHYHTANIPIYNSKTNENFTLFFGGISQYYLNENKELINDENVPFVNTISCVKRNSNNELSEFTLPISMDSFSGASAEFIFKNNIDLIENSIYDYSNLDNNQEIELGYIIGGINSTEQNPFSNNNTQVTKAESNSYKIFLKKVNTLNVEKVNNSSDFNFEINPNPISENLIINIDQINGLTNLDFIISNNLGKIIKKGSLNINNIIDIESSLLPKNQELFITLISNNKNYKTKKFIKK